MASYESFDLVFRVHDGGRVCVRLNRPGCEPQPFVLDDGLVARLRDTDLAPEPREIGSELFRALFQGSLARELQSALDRVRREETAGLRLRLVLDPTRPELAQISALPWELLYDPDERRFFGQDPRTPVVRFLSFRAADDPVPKDPPLKILLAYAEPRGTDGLRLEAEMDRLYEAAARADVHLKVLHAQDLRTLRETLDRGRFDILHFMGHGLVNRRTGEGRLLFEDTRGGPREVTGSELAHALRGIPTLRLAVLNACDTDSPASAPGLDPYAGVATALVQAGIPAVIAMRSGISDSAALSFSETLYRHLTQRRSIEEAVAKARLRLVQEHRDSLAWATPSLYLQSMNGDLFDLSGRRSERPPWWRTWTARGVAAGFILVTLFWLIIALDPQSPVDATARLTNPEGCKPILPDLNFHFVRMEMGVAKLGTMHYTDLPLIRTDVISPFCLGRYEVTRWQWWYVMQRRLGLPEPPVEERTLPASGISHEKAQEFVHRLNELAGHQVFRLPVETEWELAATRGFPDFDEMDEETLRLYANCGAALEDGHDTTIPVDSLEMDQAGLFNMLGNVYEWVGPLDVDSEEGKVIRRGGSYDSGLGPCSPTHRSDVLPSPSHHDSGLRLVREIR